MTMSYNNYNISAIILFVCVISTQFCSINSNVIINDRNLFERQTAGKVNVINKSDSINTNNQNLNKRVDNRVIQNVQKAPLDAELYGYAQLMDPRAQSPQKSNQLLANNRYNTYQQLFEGLKMSEGLPPFPQQQPLPHFNTADEESLNVMKNYFKKYDLKKYFLKKILGDAYENEEGHDEGFFGNKHLRRHGAAGWAGKVFGELIGIKIRKSIEGFGDTISDYAKEFTTNGFESIGNTFNKYFRIG